MAKNRYASQRSLESIRLAARRNNERGGSMKKRKSLVMMLNQQTQSLIGRSAVLWSDSRGFERVNDSVDSRLADVKLLLQKSLVMMLNQQTQSLTKQDVARWRRAWAMALNIENPKRGALYSIYTDALIDMHLTGCFTQRYHKTLLKAFVLTDDAGNENEDAAKMAEVAALADLHTPVGQCALAVRNALLRGIGAVAEQHTILRAYVVSRHQFHVGATSQNPADRKQIEVMLEEMGAAGWALFPEGTTIDIKESSRGDAYNVYDKRIDRANSEMSKGVVGQTMTVDDGSSKSQSETHLEVFENLCAADAKLIAYVINDDLIPFFGILTPYSKKRAGRLFYAENRDFVFFSEILRVDVEELQEHTFQFALLRR